MLFLDIIAASPLIAPDGRRAAVVSTLRQIDTDVPGAPTEATFYACCRLLSAPVDGDAPPVVSRRATLREMALSLSPGQTHMDTACTWWEAVASHYEGAADPRQAAIGATYRREAAELRRLTGN